MKLLRTLIAGGLLSLCSLRAQISFSFDYVSSTNVGFNDAANGATRRAAFESAASTLASYFTTAAPRTITFTVTSDSTNNTTLASASSNAISSATGFNRTIVQEKIITGNDTNGTTADGSISWNWYHLWDITDSVAGNAYDLKSTAMHEILHAFGFSSDISSAGKGATGATSGSPDAWSIFDRYITNSSGLNLVDTTTFSFVTGQSAALTGNPGMFFSGTAAMAANNGNRVAIFSPATWSDGSSGSHTNDSTYPGTMMISATATGPSARTLSAIEVGILSDIGYSMTAIPEPSTYAAIVGLAAFGVVVHRRRRKA